MKNLENIFVSAKNRPVNLIAENSAGRPTILPLRSIGWRGEGRGEARLFGIANYIQLLISLFLFSGCAYFQPQPLSPAQTAVQLESRRLDDAGLKIFFEHNSGHELQNWPLEKWDLQTLSLAAFYFHPSLEVARAQWQVAQAGIKTAGGRPNPTVSLVPGYDTSATLGVNPWLPAVSFDLPIETAGKRGKRIAVAKEVSESARFSFITAAWKVRSDVRANLLDLKIAERRADSLQKQFSAQQQIVKLLQQRFDAGEISRPELTTAQIALNKTQLDLGDAQSKRASARSELAQAIGVTAEALDGVEFLFDFSQTASDDLTSADARRVALQSRADILGALADYAAAEDDLRLEIAKQFPDVHLNPGYQFDQGDNKWSLGLMVELPILNQNQGPIAEAEARRKLAAAKFVELQAQVIGEIDRAVAGWRVAEEQLKTGNSLFESEQQQQKSAEAQLKAGAADQLDFVSAQIELNSASLTQLDNETKLQTALGALEDAVQSPLTLSPQAVHAAQTNSLQTSNPISK
jgi:cobalt-zinc-cadmium efflux system outer membrane protein